MQDHRSTGAQSTVRWWGVACSCCYCSCIVLLLLALLPLKPTMPQKAAGMRSEPPKSDPVASQPCLAATAAADPPDDPPAAVRRSYGETVVSKSALNECEPAWNSGVFVLPTTTPPMLSSCSTIGSDTDGTRSLCSGDPSVQRTPATAWASFTKMGRP